MGIQLVVSNAELGVVPPPVQCRSQVVPTVQVEQPSVQQRGQGSHARRPRSASGSSIENTVLA
ncbi:MAG: hypothetical protein WCB57_16550 [Pseudonocardiaceae bacterium]